MPSEASVVLPGRALVAGEAKGRSLVLGQGLSLAMAVDVKSGRILDVHSEHVGRSVVGSVLVMPAGRGSSSASTALAEAIRLGTAPAAIVLTEVDEILAVGAIVARRLYGRTCPITVLGKADHARLQSGQLISVGADGSVTLSA